MPAVEPVWALERGSPAKWSKFKVFELGGTMNNVIVYPVGLFSDWKRKRVRHGMKRVFSNLSRAELRNVKNYFNGYLAEHEFKGTRCGTGWTKRRAMKDLIHHLVNEC